MRERNEAPTLACPKCDKPLITATDRGRFDSDDNFIPHGDACRCRWCGWFWFDDIDPVVCECGARVRVEADCGYAFAVEVP